VVNKFLKQTRIAYYSEKIIACTHDKKGHLLGDKGSTSLPLTSELTEMFSSFFINKIQNIRRVLQIDQTHSIDQDIDTSSVNTPLEKFTDASEDEVKTLIMKSPSKSCSLDLMPTWHYSLSSPQLSVSPWIVVVCPDTTTT